MKNLARPLIRVLDAAVILNFLADFLYCPYMVLVILRPADGSIGPLMGKAASVPPDLMMARRLYTIEAWIAFIALILYLRFRKDLWKRWISL
ncbi:MAG: hypothetical protein JNL01_02155 [Bdellovibrionales bacterium]|nr:hypothetical protein [Bdellovibrionales bacterium]